MNTGESPPFGFEDTSFQTAGGVDGVRKLVDAFYDVMDTTGTAKTLRAMHAEDLTESREKLARFLCGWLGGPNRYREKYGSINIPQAHRHLHVSMAERDAWVSCMDQALDQQAYPENFSTYLKQQLRVPADRILEVSQHYHRSS